MLRCSLALRTCTAAATATAAAAVGCLAAHSASLRSSTISSARSAGQTRATASRAAAAITTSLRWCSTTAAGNTSSGTDNAGGGAAATPSPPQQRRKRKIQIAVVGSGPSGCFVASHLVKKHPDLHVDVFERLPVPFGLCRYGVAPDHPDVKNVEKQFMELFQGGRVSWIGNVTIGKEIPVQALLSNYAAVVFATGADGSKKLRIPGEDLAGVISARSFVEYYNTYPFPFGSPRFCPFDIERTKRAVVIGNGNVAMDVVRVLGGSYKYFCPTDMNCVCVKEMMKNRIEHISVVGRRGVEHSAFATAEFRELTKYQEGHVKVEVDPFDLATASAAVPTGKTKRAHTRQMELVHQFVVPDAAMAEEKFFIATDKDGVPLPTAAASASSSSSANNSPTSGSGGSTVASAGVREGSVSGDRRGACTLRFRYDLTPIAVLPSRHRKNCVGGVLFQRTAKPTAADGGGAAAAAAEPEYCVLPCDLVLTSIGYRSDSITDVPFDHRAGVIDNVKGRVKGMPRVYCSGWVKNGAKGVILHSVVDAQETVTSILADIAAGVIPTDATAEEETEDGDEDAKKKGEEGDAATAATAAEAEGTLVVETLSPDPSPAMPASTAATHNSTAKTTMLGKYGLVDYFVAKKLQPVSVAGLQRVFHVEHQRGVDLGKKAEKIDTVRDMLDVALGGDVGRKADERIRRITPARSDAMMYLKELLDDDTDLAPLAHELAKDIPHKLAQQHPLGRISPSQL